MRLRIPATTAVAITATALLLTGCTGQSTPASTDAADGPQKITIATSQNDTDAMQKVIDDFKASHPDVEVSLTSAEPSSYQTTLRTQLSAGNGPDIMFAWAGAGNPAGGTLLANAGYLKDLSDQAWVSELPESFKPMFDLDGKTYLRPLTVGGIGAIYNMDALKEVGAEVPTTWSEVLDLCRTAASNGKVAYALGAGTAWNTQLINYALTPTLVYRDDPEFAQQMSDGTATFADSAWKDSFEKYLTMQQEGCFQPSPLGTSYEAAMDLVAGGEALGSVQTQTGLPQLLLRNPDGDFVLNPFPATDDPDQTRMAAAGGSIYAINADAENPALTQEFFDFMISDAEANEYARIMNSVPAVRNGESEVPTSVAPLIQYLDDDEIVPFMDVFWPSARVQQAHFTAVQDLLADKISVDDALKQMDDAYQQG